MKIIITLFLIISVVGCSKPSNEEAKVASNACQKFISKQMGVLEKHTKVFDVWMKNGAIVVEVGYKEYPFPSADSYSVRKCIYDEKNGRISSPSPLSDREWSK